MNNVIKASKLKDSTIRVRVCKANPQVLRVEGQVTCCGIRCKVSTRIDYHSGLYDDPARDAEIRVLRAAGGEAPYQTTRIVRAFAVNHIIAHLDGLK